MDVALSVIGMKRTTKKYAVKLKANRAKPLTSIKSAPAKAAASSVTPAIILADVNSAVATIRGKLPVPRVLTNDDRRGLFKMSDKRAAFVQNAVSAAENVLVQAVLPPSFDRATFAANADLVASLVEVRTVIEQLFSDIDDTTMAFGSDTVIAAAKLYGYVKAGAEDHPGLKPIAAQLGEAFKKANTKPVAKPTAESSNP